MHVIICGQRHGSEFQVSGGKFQVLNHRQIRAKVMQMPDDNPSGFLRLFIAIAVPPEVRDEISRAQGQLRRDSPPGTIRWTRPDQFHVTLKYLGDVPAGQAAALGKIVSGVCAGFSPLRLAAHGIGFFPNTQKPRVIWAGAEDNSGQLAELHRQMDGAVRPFAPAEKPERFTSHITLGRFKPGRHGSYEKLLERAAALRDRNFGGWLAGAVEIVRSELTSTGARHTPLASCPLAMATPPTGV
jgi:RNA 2',3'-cyclic 3'-phosphodiesterase